MGLPLGGEGGLEKGRGIPFSSFVATLFKLFL